MRQGEGNCREMGKRRGEGQGTLASSEIGLWLCPL